jgi:hypothetical protein
MTFVSTVAESIYNNEYPPSTPAKYLQSFIVFMKINHIQSDNTYKILPIPENTIFMRGLRVLRGLI